MLGEVLPKSRCRILHLDFGNTEVVPLDLGKKKIADIRVQKFACGLIGNSLTYYILPWFFPQWIRGPSFWDLGFFFCRSFGGDPKPIAAANPSHNNILLYFLSKYSTNKTISELRSNWWSFVLTGTSRSTVEGQMDGEANCQSPSWHDNRTADKN